MESASKENGKSGERRSGASGAHAACHMLHATCYSLHATCRMLHTTCHMLHVTYYMLHATCYILLATYYVLHAACYTLHTTHYTLHATQTTKLSQDVLHATQARKLSLNGPDLASRQVRRLSATRNSLSNVDMTWLRSNFRGSDPARNLGKRGSFMSKTPEELKRIEKEHEESRVKRERGERRLHCYLPRTTT